MNYNKSLESESFTITTLIFLNISISGLLSFSFDESNYERQGVVECDEGPAEKESEVAADITDEIIEIIAEILHRVFYQRGLWLDENRGRPVCSPVYLMGAI